MFFSEPQGSMAMLPAVNLKRRLLAPTEPQQVELLLRHRRRLSVLLLRLLLSVL